MFAQGDASEVRTIKSKCDLFCCHKIAVQPMKWMKKQTKMDSKFLLLNSFSQISLSFMFCSKTRPISASRSCLAEHMAKFKMSIRLNLSTFYEHCSQTNENTKKCFSQIDIKRNFFYCKVPRLLGNSPGKFFKIPLLGFWLPKKKCRSALLKGMKFLEARFHRLRQGYTWMPFFRHLTWV